MEIPRDNVDKIGRIGWGYVPGTSIDMKVDYTGELSKCPTENVLTISEALAFVHSKCAEAFKNKPRDPGCETAYDMRPWTVSNFIFDFTIFALPHCQSHF